MLEHLASEVENEWQAIVVQHCEFSMPSYLRRVANVNSCGNIRSEDVMRQKQTFSDQDGSLLAQEQYLRVVKWLPRLSNEEQVQLLERVERGKHERAKPCPDTSVVQDAQQARDRLVEGFQPLVIFLARRYQRRLQAIPHLELLDLIQDGNLGLLQAIERHDRRLGSLSSLAGRCICMAIIAAVWQKGNALHYPQHVCEELGRLYTIERRLEVGLGREVSCEELATALGISQERVRQLVQWRQRGQVSSLEVAVTVEEQDDGSCLILSLYEPEDGYPADELEGVVQEAVERLLSPVQRDVLCLRYGLHGQPEALSTAVVASLLGKPSYTIQREERRAKEQLRGVLAPYVRHSDSGEVA